MVWSVTYYNKNRQRSSLLIEARTRAELYAQLSERQIKAVRIDEGDIYAKSRRRTMTRKLHLSCCVIIVLGLLACITLFNTDDSRRDVRKENRISSVKNSGQKTKPFRAAKTVKLTSKVDAPEITKPDVLLEPLKSIPKGLALPKLTYENAADEFLSSMVFMKPGDRFLFVPDELEFNRLFLEAVKNPLQINPDDSEELKVEKQAVNDLKQSILSRVNQDGCMPGELVRESCEEMNLIADYRDKLEENLQLVIESEDIKLAKEYQDEANIMLGEYGAEPLRLIDEESINWVAD